MRVDRQLLVMAGYGFVSGLPLPLSGFTFRLWLSDSGAALAIVGLTAWIGLAYSLKFLWAPLLDQPPPLRVLRGFGRRRGWLLSVQPALGLAAVMLALSDPAAAPVAAFAVAVVLAAQVAEVAAEEAAEPAGRLRLAQLRPCNRLPPPWRRPIEWRLPTQPLPAPQFAIRRSQSALRNPPPPLHNRWFDRNRRRPKMLL